ncbi:hypothetical protein M8C21_007667 [Ambrosia artemisiifolia]|uniref:ABC transporter domain-containing protein n=1 Tax=Ambrosia artemisiifolia TaxID=4212 RepID=A0AAD5GZK2_AMBAR|nr:hypothetical protein M8C21_007667 [Ambrosia artemisiifolia]
MAASDGSEYFDVDIESGQGAFSRRTNTSDVQRDETELLWAAIERLPSGKEKKTALMRRQSSGSSRSERTETIDVTKLDRRNRSLIVKKALDNSDQDNYKLLAAIKERFDRVGLEVPKVEVRFENLNIEADVLIGSRALPTLLNYARDVIERLLTCLRLFRPKRHRLSILKDISGSIKPGRMTLLLGPPSSGKSTLLLALAGKLDTGLKNLTGTNTTLGYAVLQFHNLPTEDYWYWLGVGTLLLYALLFNIMVTLTLAYLNPLKNAQVVLPSTIGGADDQANPAKSESPSRRQGMILPFKPLSMTFHNISYFVDMPEEMVLEGAADKKLQLLSDVSGVFLPGVLTALMGSSGAGKTTLMDVLAGRKTGGYIEGEITISGFQKEQSTFARVSGYVEQNDIHSPQVTVMESLLFSAFLRLPPDVLEKERREFVEGVMRLVELDVLRDALVGIPGSTGLSTEQRKRLTIAVELVANPSIIFMDEPTSGLDARAAAIVMRTVRNTVDTGRTVVCTIHQPSIEIFEAFDELLLMKRGGRVIYGGKVGERADILIKYFESINGISPMPSDYNPANWMLEMTTPAVEERIGQDFAVIYKNSNQYREIEALIEQTSTPMPGSEPIHFSTTYSQTNLYQFKTCLWKQNLVYWRSPQYNVVRLLFTTLCALIIGSVFWDIGSKRNSTQHLMLVVGALYTAVLFLGVNNASTVQPVVAIERTGLVEIPYIATQTIIYGVTTYFMINFEKKIGKFLLYLVFMFLTFTYFTFFGMVTIGLTPTQQMAAVVSSAFYSLWNLIAGFLLPKPQIPGWWIWCYYLSPMAWTLQGLIGSQLGDVEDPIVGPDFNGTVKGYLKEGLGIEYHMIGVSAVAIFAFSLFFFLVFALSLKFLNFQKR